MRSLLVIGSGWAGISAAMRAAEQGWSVKIVEERPYIGGRSRSFVDKVTGETIDNGQHLLMGCYHNTLGLLDTLGTRGNVSMQPNLNVPFVDAAKSVVLNTGLLPGAMGVALGIARLKGLSIASRLGILRLATAMKLGRATAKGLTCSQFLEANNQTLEAVKRFWEPVILATLNSPIESADARLLISVMNLAFMGSGEDSRLVFPTSGLSELLSPFPEWLSARGGTVAMSTRCDSLSIESGIIREASFSDGSSMTVDAVIVAAPQISLDRLLPGEYQLNKTWETEPSPIISVYLWYSQSWMTSPFAAALGTTIQWVFNRRQIQNDAPASVMEDFPGHVSLTISAGSGVAKLSSEEIIAAADKELRSLFTMPNAKLLHGQVIKEKRATPLITPKVERPSSDAMHGVASNLWLAGDWVDTGLPATIEGAVLSGVQAVESMSDAKAP